MEVAFSIDRGSPGTLTGKVVRELRRRIADGDANLTVGGFDVTSSSGSFNGAFRNEGTPSAT